MKVSVENLENDVVRLKIEVDDEVVEEELNRAYKKIVGKLNVPGFRKGKAPRWIVEQRYGKEILLEESYPEIVSRSYTEALSETKIQPMAQPEISDLDFNEDGSDFTFAADVPVRPTVELGTYKGIEMDKIEPVVTDEDVEAYIDQLRNQYAEYVTIDRDDLQDGDTAIVNIETLVEDKPIPGGASAGVTIQVGDDYFGPDTDAQLIGLAVGEEKVLEITLPEDRSDEYAGKEAAVRVTLQEIRQLRVPELDAEFVGDIEAALPQEDEGEEETSEETVTEKDEKEVVQAFKDKVRRQLEESSKAQATEKFEEKVVAKAIEESKFNLHDKIVSERAEVIRNRYTKRLAYSGISLEQYLSLYGVGEEDFEEITKTEATRELGWEFVMDAVAEAEGIEVTDEEIDQWVREMLAGTKVTDAQIALYKDLAETSLKRTKAMEFVVDASVPNVIEKTLSEISSETADDAEEVEEVEDAE